MKGLISFIGIIAFLYMVGMLTRNVSQREKDPDGKNMLLGIIFIVGVPALIMLVLSLVTC